MSGAPSSQCYVEVVPNSAILTGCFERGIQVLPKPGERRCWVPMGSLFSDEQQREWRFLLECWCLYHDLEVRPYHWPIPVKSAPKNPRSGGQGVEVALTPTQILEFLDWAGSVSRHEKPTQALASLHRSKLRAFLVDDLDAAEEIRVIAGHS